MNAKNNDFERHRRKFYALIGHCVTGYQSVEDYLPDLFAAALGGDTAKAGAIFAVVRELEAKLNIITAALIGTEERYRTRWTTLRPRVAKAAEARNQIAHATPTHNAGLLHVT